MLQCCIVCAYKKYLKNFFILLMIGIVRLCVPNMVDLGGTMHAQYVWLALLASLQKSYS